MCNDQKVSLNSVRTLVLIDDTVKDFQSLVKGLLPSSQIIVIQPNFNELEQMTQTLNKYTRLKSLHIISNGSPGCLYFGKSHLSLFNMKCYASQLKTWSVPNILLYGFNVAAGSIGKEFVRRFHLVTGANIGASIWEVDDTGKGVSLQLNYFLGEINSNLTILPEPWQRKITIFQH